MAYSDPQALTVSGSAKSLPRTGSSPSTGEFKTADGVYALRVQHNRTQSRATHVARVELRDIVANPLVPSTNQPINAAVTFTVNGPNNGLDSATLVALSKALVGWLTDANLGKLVGSEN